MSRVRGALLFLSLPTVVWTLLLGFQLGVAVLSLIHHNWVGVIVSVLIAGWAFSFIVRLTTIDHVSATSVWILAKWKDIDESDDGANWELTAAFHTREEAIANSNLDEFVARLPIGVRTPEEPTTFPDAEWISEVSA